MTVKVAILGTGWGARIQVPAFRYAGMEVTGIWARTEEKARQVAHANSIPYATSDYHELLRRDDVDLVSIVTPPHTHAELAIMALEAGVHVLCEKPTALNAKQARQMLAVSQSHSDLISLIDHELRFNPTRQKMKQLITEGYVGEPYHVETTVLGASMLNPKHIWNWWMEREKGGGLWGAAGSHAVDALMWLLGRKVQSLEATFRTFNVNWPDAEGKPHQMTSDDYCAVKLKFEDGISGLINLSAVTTGAPLTRVVVSGSKGTLWFEDQKLRGYKAGTTTPEDLTVSLSNEGLPEVLLSGEFPRHTATIALALKHAIETGDRSGLVHGATFEDGLYIQRVLDAGYESSDKAKWVTV